MHVMRARGRGFDSPHLQRDPPEGGSRHSGGSRTGSRPDSRPRLAGRESIEQPGMAARATSPALSEEAGCRRAKGRLRPPPSYVIKRCFTFRSHVANMRAAWGTKCPGSKHFLPSNPESPPMARRSVRSVWRCSMPSLARPIYRQENKERGRDYHEELRRTGRLGAPKGPTLSKGVAERHWYEWPRDSEVPLRLFARSRLARISEEGPAVGLGHKDRCVAYLRDYLLPSFGSRRPDEIMLFQLEGRLFTLAAH